jgi:hypothetical protein
MNPQNFNRYAYGLNNPVRYIDPSGHTATCGRPDCKNDEPPLPPPPDDDADAPLHIPGIPDEYIANYLAERGIADAPFNDPSFSTYKIIQQDLIIQTAYENGVIGQETYTELGQWSMNQRMAGITNEEIVATMFIDMGVVLAGGMMMGGGNRSLPNNALVCRGGLCTADRFASGSGVTVNPDGTLSGVSVNSALNKSINELTISIPNSQVGVTTVGEIRAAGGNVFPSPTSNNPYHCTMCGITAQQAESLFTPTIKNPNRR